MDKHPRLYAVAASLIVVTALYVARGVLIPFSLAVLLSFLLAPLVTRLQRWGLARGVAVGAAVLLLLSVVGCVGWIVAGEVHDLSAKPEYQENIRAKAHALHEFLGKPLSQARVTVDSLGAAPAPESEAASLAPAAPPTAAVAAQATPLQSVRAVLEPLLGTLTVAAMVSLFAVLMLLRREDLRDRFIRLVGSGEITLTTQALDEASKRVSNYLARQCFLNGLLGAAVGIGLALVGIPSAVLWGLVFALLRFIPYVGVWIAAAFPFLLSLALSDGWSQPLQTIAVIAVLDGVGSLVLEPWIYSGGTGISPLAILISALFWSWLWGPFGLVLATPLTVCLVVLGKYVPQLGFLHMLFSDVPALSPPARLYQRLLAQDQDESWTVLKSELGERPIHETQDALVLPVLALAEHDRRQGKLDDEAARQLYDNVQLLIDECEELPRPRTDPAQQAAPAAAGMRIQCLPARGTADVLSARMLAHMLADEGGRVEVVPLAELMGETLKNFVQQPVDLVFVSAVPPSRFMRVRYICKRLREQFPELEIVVCMWMLELGSPEAAERLPAGKHIHTVSTLGEALAKVRELASSLRISRTGRVA